MAWTSLCRSVALSLCWCGAATFLPLSATKHPQNTTAQSHAAPASQHTTAQTANQPAARARFTPATARSLTAPHSQTTILLPWLARYNTRPSRPLAASPLHLSPGRPAEWLATREPGVGCGHRYCRYRVFFDLMRYEVDILGSFLRL